jgi:hypothetical protein
VDTLSLADALFALIGRLDSATPPELRVARKQLKEFAQDQANPRMHRRLAMSLAVVLDEVK